MSPSPAPLVIFPDVELWATEYLRTRLPQHQDLVPGPVYVDIRRPDPPRPRMVVLNQDGGLRRNVALATARLRIRCWAPSDEDATALASLVEALIWASATGDPVVNVQGLGRPTNLPEQSNQPGRLQWVELLLRGTDKE